MPAADNLEIAALPTTDPKERERLLSFVISGGGPTGVETAAEIYDMLNEDVLDYFPKLLRSQAKVHLIQSREHILNTYSEKISEYAEKKFAKDDVVRAVPLCPAQHLLTSACRTSSSTLA
jgi:NADH dehydrogenase